MGAEVVESRFRGASALTLTSGDLVATFLPDLGMTGVSLQYRGVEHLALPGGLAALRAGATLGLPLLAPWANRLATRQYRAGGVSVDLRGLELTTDDNGLPMHGLLVGKPGWRIGRRGTRGDTTWLRAAIDVDAPAFPFPHRVELKVTARDARLTVGATVIPTGRRPVPIAFGWHPYLRLPTTGRSTWRLRASDSRPPDVGQAEHSDRCIQSGTGRSGADWPAYVRRSLPTRATTTPCARGGQRRDRTALRRELSVRPGVGPARPGVRRSRADGCAHQRASRRNGAVCAERRGLHRNIRAHDHVASVRQPERPQIRRCTRKPMAPTTIRMMTFNNS